MNRALLTLIAIGMLAAGCTDNTARAFQEGQTAQNLLDAGNLPAARNAIARALALRGDQVDLLLLEGRIRYRMQDYGGAFDSYNMALALDPNNTEALQAVSQIGASTGHERESTAATEQILALDPNNVAALLVRGVRQLNRRDYAGVNATGDRMLAIDPQSEPGLVLKARGLSLLGQGAAATALLSDGLKRRGPTQMVVTALLENARDQHDAELMINQFRLLGDLVPRNADLTIDETNVQYKRGNLNAARARGWALLAENGTKEAAMQRLSDLWTEYDKAPLTPQQLARLSAQGAAPARLMAARFYLANGDAKTAAGLVGSLGGDDAAGVRARIAYVTSNGNDVAAAEQVLTRDETNCDALGVRAAAAVRRGRPADGVVAAQVMATECPDSDGYDLLAQAYRAQDQKAGVRRAYLEWIRIRPLAAQPVARYVTWLIANGEPDEAIGVARRLTQRAPAKPSSWQLLKAVCTRASQAVCVAEANAGAAEAARNFAIDLPPGERRVNPLLGNSWQ